ncbi:hypothetical protein GYMLUDRAFT_99613 [Collybiopsis luxurians FD-317 M1]|uniref:Unplaced genomic scaffold GYMLUscaffold_59, whole genome shotgun sequence n=1 Tax=Collybiopsis luxurians FD-317 M1 TaxID=944289 RepID=A0A0D0BKU9_9AGAR|nr:hypothetical protein GYMLUDRAFT_99613 [Collybiopsis luxurians FD-317 M1]
MNGARYKKRIYDELASQNPNVTSAHYADASRYEHKLIAAFDLAQLPPQAGAGVPPAPAPAPIAPLVTGMAELLAGQQRILNTLVGVQVQLAQVDRRSAILANQTRGNGMGKPYEEVRFPDNTLPSQPGQGRAALPVLNTMLDIRALSGPDVTNYLRNHGILPDNVPHSVVDRRKKLAEIIGCIEYYEL